MTTEAKIRRMHDVGGSSIKAITRQTSLSRNTVRRIVRAEQVGNVYKRTTQAKPKLGEYETILEAWLLSDAKLRKKERRSAMKCFTMLQSQGYQGAYDSVQRYIKVWKRQRSDKVSAYVPLVFDPAEAYQFDWSEEYAEIAGVKRKLKLAHFRLCHSRAFFVVAYWRETQEMLFDAHNQAFLFFGGLPNRGIYDNMKTVVSQIFAGKERTFTRGFLSLMDHYRIEPVACSPAAGWEKGQVENQVDNLRDWLFKPCPKFESLEALNVMLSHKCQQLASTRHHPVYKDKTIANVLVDEQPYLRPVENLFDGHQEQTIRVNSMCLVRYDRNVYSVRCAYANQLVTMRAYPACLEFYADGEQIGHHKRQFGREQTCFDPLHYLPLLKIKPGALRNGAPFKDWKLPKAIMQVKEKLMKRKNGDRECVTILCAINEHGMEAVEVACELALHDGVVNQAVILNSLNRLHQDAKPDTIETPINLTLSQEPVANCQQYNQLLQGGEHAL